jgi:hypothetical protein
MFRTTKLFLLVFIFLLNVKAEGQWNLQTYLGINEHISYLCVVDTLSAWGVGSKGFSDDTSLVYKMEYPGFWYNLPVQDFMCTSKLTCIAATDLLNAWIGTDSGKIYVTSNGGINWSIVFDFGGSGYINDIKFSKTNKLVGYANCDPPGGYGTPFKIIKTINGGLNWTLYSPIFPSNYMGMAVSSCVTDSNHYWMGLNCYNNFCGVPAIAFTTNGGTNWQTRTVSYTAHYVCPIEFTSNNQTGFCSSSGALADIYLHKTTNGGYSWTNTFLLPIEPSRILMTLDWIEGTTTWYFSSSSYQNVPIYKSTNDGVNWIPMEINNNYDQIEHASFIKKNDRVWGYAATVNGKIFQLAGDSVNIVNINKNEHSVPENYSLFQNYPNPFNPTTTIKFSIPSLNPPFNKGGTGGFVTLKVCNILGKEVAILVNEKLQAGIYEVKFDGTNLPSGVYYYRIETESYCETKKMLMIK